MYPGTIVKKGTYFYGCSVECDLCVVYSPIRYGSGDYEDPSDIANDKEVDTYYLYFGSTTERGKYNAGGDYYSTLHEAMVAAESTTGIGQTVRWASE